MNDPLAKEKLDGLFETLDSNPSILKNKESDQIEYKKSFSIANIEDYLRLFCSSANAEGMYVIFGIEPDTRGLLGLQNDKFENTDPSKIDKYVKSKLSEGIRWNSCVHELGKKRFGIIYIYPSQMKPVMFTSNSNKRKFQEGDILYRYGGETTRIKPAELQKIIRDRVKQERRSWQNLLNNIAKISPEEAIFMDKKDGSINMSGKKIFIDEKALSQLNLIREGMFHEKDGAPAYILKGEIENISAAILIQGRPRAIYKNDLYDAFFRGKCEYPDEYLKSLVHESSYYLPIWFFIEQSEKELDEICSMISSIDDCSRHTQEKILERIQSEKADNLRVSSIFPEILFDDWNFTDLEKIREHYEDKLSTKAKKKVLRSIIREFLLNDAQVLLDADFTMKHPDVVVEAITHLPQEAVEKNFETYKELLNIIRKLIGVRKCGTDFRKAICYIDYCHYRKA